MKRLFANRSYFDYLIAIVTVIAIIFIFKELVSIGEDEKRSNVERSQDVSKMMKNFVIPPPKENQAPPKPVIVTKIVTAFKAVPIKEQDEDEKNAIVTHKVVVVKTVAVKVTETASVTEQINF